jgi:hypothetical protein
MFAYPVIQGIQTAMRMQFRFQPPLAGSCVIAQSDISPSTGEKDNSTNTFMQIGLQASLVR